MAYDSETGPSVRPAKNLHYSEAQWPRAPLTLMHATNDQYRCNSVPGGGFLLAADGLSGCNRQPHILHFRVVCALACGQIC